jgi:hypothetical protein
MKLRHTAALALTGWYLMLAPRTSDTLPVTYDATAPLGQWNVVGSYDTAAECDKGKHEIPNQILQNRDKMTAEKKVAATQTVTNLLSSSDCIASDDPRLKSK